MIKKLYLLFSHYINANIAFVWYLLFKLKVKKSKKIWLIGGINAELYTDNSKVFYEYLLEKHPEIECFWIAREGSPAHKMAKGNILFKGSIESYFYYYRSEAVVFSDTHNSDIAPSIFVMPFLRAFSKKVFQVRLNHGTIAFKKMPVSFSYLQKIRDKILLEIDLNTASTELEVKVMNTYMKKNSVVLTGSARNDSMVDIEPEQKFIFIAPTWRSWLYGKSDITESEFYNQYVNLLSNKLFLDYLKRNNLVVELFLHHFMLPHLEAFKYLDNDVVNILSPDVNLSSKILGASLMITDYSSICTERYYLKKPVIFFQFDQEQYESEMGSYIDLKNDTFGDVSTNIQELVKKIIFSIENEFPISPLQIEGEKYFVHFTDKHNCDRIFTEITKRLEY